MIPKNRELIVCEKCGIPLAKFENQLRTIGIKNVEGDSHYYCYKCYELIREERIWKSQEKEYLN